MRYIAERLQVRLLPVRSTGFSPSLHASFPLLRAHSLDSQLLAEGSCGPDRQPPDIPDSGTPGFHTQQKAFTLFAQRPMNEQTIRTRSLREASQRGIPDTGGGPASTGATSSIISSLTGLLSSFAGYANPMTTAGWKGACSVLTLLLLWVMSAQAQSTINLRLHKAISNSAPVLGDVVTYSLVVANAPGSTTATNVSVKDQLLGDGVTYVPNSASALRGKATFASVFAAAAITNTWTIPSIAPGDSVVVVMKATVVSRGVWFDTAEIAAADQKDLNSTPNNGSLLEDDYSAVCFSVPLLWYPGDEFTVTIPSGYKQIVWYRNETPISTSAVSTSLAQVNSNFSLTIKSPGTYRFEVAQNGCPASGCCPVQVNQGPYGSLGNYVFLDSNKDGAQTTGEPGIDNATVQLYDKTATTLLRTTVTAGGGKYLFDSLTDGSYVVKFVSPTGYQSTTANAAGIADDVDSDAGANGFTGVYTIDTSQPESSTAHTNLTVDAGYYVPSASLGDLVFADMNQDGIHQPTEPGVEGVVATLYVNGVVSLTALTNASGIYSFTGLTPGSSVSYVVGFTAPSGYTATLANQGSDDAKDSDADVLTGRTQSVTLVDGENNTSLDAGFSVPRASLGDLVFADTNKDGVQQPTELGIANVMVALLDSTNTLISNTLTNASGIYSFTGLTPGVPYSVSFVSPTGYTSTSAQIGGNNTLDSDANPTTGLTRSIKLTPGENNLNFDAGFYQPITSLGDFVFVDSNKDGIQQPTESGMSNVVVVLLDGANTVITSTTTTSTGAYSFTGLTPGIPYSVRFVSPTGYVSTSALIGGNDALDSDADPITGQTRSATLALGENNTSFDAGFYVPSASLGGVVFADTNKDGIHQPTEPSIEGVVATLYVNGVVSLTALTNASGIYSFTGLTPGSSVSYVVGFTAPSGYIATLANQGGDDAADSDADVLTGRTQAVNLTNGGTTSLDAGFSVPPASLGDLVFLDANKDGIQQPTEPGIANVVVALLDGTNTLIASTTTNVSGIYSFTGLTPGVPYSVSFVSPTGYISTSAQVGGNNILDSDANLVTGLTRSVTLTPGENNLNLDAGFYIPTASLGDFVFDDTSKDGYQQPGEPGIPGVVVVLLDGANTPIASTTTSSSGTYSFTGLTAGVPYSVSVVAPAGYQSTGGSSGSGIDDTRNSDVNPITGQTRSVTLAVGEVNTNLDAGFFLTCPTDFSLVVSKDSTLCNGNSITLTASSPVPGAKIDWYLTPNPGMPFVTVNSGVNVIVTPTATTTYYVEVTANGCKSARKPVVITVPDVPTPTIAANTKNTCPATTVDLTTTLIANKTPDVNYEWYTSANRSEVTRVANLTAVGAGKYYLFAKSGNCYSDPSVVTVGIVDCNCQNIANVNAGSGVEICSGEVAPLKAVLSGSATSVTWETNGTGTFSNPASLTATYTPSAADIATGNVLLTATTNDPDGTCAAASSSLIVKINARPAPPVDLASDDTIVCQGSSTKLVAFATGAKINWYDQDGKLIGTTQSGGKLVVTPATAGAVVYTAEAFTEAGCISARSSLTLTVGACLADLAVVKQVVTPGPYSVGQKITYGVTVTNNGPITASGVTVTDLLPASLTYVSSTPTGQYNPATGSWTIGMLTAGSNRSLLIEATIMGVGSTKSTAIVGSPENDPKYAQNDTSSVMIQAGACVVQAPVIDCAIAEICKGGTTTLSATGCADGTVIWSDGKSGITIFATPSVTTTYSASCVVGKCTSAISNTVTVTVTEPKAPVITASADNVCPGTSLTLTASGCAGGVIEWSDKAQTGASIVVIPNSKTTYTAQCRMGNCLSSPATKTINIVTEIPTPTIASSTSVVCPGETLTLTAENCLGTPVWSSTTATTGSILVTPTAGNNTYSVYCKNGACVSKTSSVLTIKLVAPVIPTVTASADTVCAKGSVILTAADCNGTVVWNVGGLTGPSITVNPTANISYFAQCQYRTCMSAQSNTVNITVVTPTAPIISASKTLVCSGDKVTLTTKGCAGTIQWHGIDRVGASIEIYPTGTTEYYATCKQGVCESEISNKVRVTVNTSAGPAPVVAASTTAVCANGVVSLTATACNGEVKWSDGQMGAVVSVTATTTNHSFYALCMPGSTTACGSSKSNVINVEVTPTPTPTIVRCLCSADTICPSETVKLSVINCQGTPHWSTNETTSSIIVSPAVTTAYTVYCQDGICKSDTAKPYTITVIPVTAPTITASATVVAADSTVTLTAKGCVGTVLWSANDISGNNIGASIVVRPNGTQTYYAQCQFRECLSDPSNTIIVNPGDCAAKAGTLVAVNPVVCGGSSTTVAIGATANGGLVQPTGYSVLYVLTSGAGNVVRQASNTPQFNVSSDSATYTIHTLVYSPDSTSKNFLDMAVVKQGITTMADVQLLIGSKCADMDAAGATVKVNTVTPPVLSVASLTVCSGGTVSLTATGCTGGTVTWSDGTVGATYAKAATSEQYLTATCTVNGCLSKSSDSLHVTLGSPAMPMIVSNKPIACVSEAVTLTASGCAGGTYVWSDGKIGNTLTINPTADVSYRVKCKMGECEGDWSASTTITVGAPAAPTISTVGSTGSTTACFGMPITLTAEGCSPNSYVTWSNNLVGKSITVSLATSMTLTARCANSENCRSVPSNQLVIMVLPKVPQPVVIDKTNTCPLTTVDLTTAIVSHTNVVGGTSTAGGVLEFYTDAALTNKVTDPATVGTGTYYVVERTINGCVSLPLAIHVQINSCTVLTACDTQNPATANAGADASACASTPHKLNGSIGGAAKTAHWTTSGTGLFDNPYALNALYTPSAADILSGKVTLTLSASTNNAACPVATDNMVLSIDGIKSIPVITMAGAANLCYGDSVTLKAPAGAAAYKWSNNATTPNIVVKTSGSYTVQLLDANGCGSVKSAEVVVNVAAPVQPLLVTNLRNSCPSKVVDLTKALSSTTVGSYYTYRTCNDCASNIVMRPDSVNAGTYWIVETTASGCVSAPAKVMVSVVDCTADTLGTDVSLTKTASTARVTNGAPVTYTITVSNAGPHTAKNIDVRDVLPQGLELVANPTPDYKVSNGVITKRIDSLATGQSTQIVYSARITAKGQTVVNRAEIMYLDNKDTNPANNTSSVAVKDTTMRRASLIGLAKSVLGLPLAISDSLIRASYSFVVTNFGEDTLRNVKVSDDLAYAFVPNIVQSVKVTAPNGSTLKTNPAFTGIAYANEMLDSTSYILPGASQTFTLDVTVKRAAGDTTRSFKNIANASAINSLKTVTDMSINGGDSDPDNDGDPTNNYGFSSFTLGTPQQKGPAIGLALAVVKVEQQPDSSYNVTYKATLKNVGDVNLIGIVLTDSLIQAMASPASYSVVSAPVVGAGSTLVPNALFNGGTQPNILTNASQLAVGVQDTVLITVNIKTNGNGGPFYSSAVVVAHTPDSNQVVKDISNNGFNPAPAGSLSTTVRFDLPKGLLGVAKTVGTPKLVEEGVYDVPYTITLSNMGSTPLRKVQVVDNLSETFKHGALIVSNSVPITGTGTIAVNSLYTGQGTVTNMLVDSLSKLDVGAKSTLNFTVRVNVKNADSLTFLNTARATAVTPANEVVEDVSTTGINNDPDNDLDPRNNSQPTPVDLSGVSKTSFIGLAMTVRDTARQANGSFNVMYQIVVKNYGTDPLTNVSISDTLTKVFNSQTGATYSIVKAPFTTSTGSALKLNLDFNGDTQPVLVLGDSTSRLAAGKVDTIRVVVNVFTDGSTTTFLNTAYAYAKAPTGTVSDVSTSGLEPDLNGNGNPTDSNEREATPLSLPSSFLSVFIPEGFSPNGDGINDLFVIRGATGLTVSLDVYNRWGSLVYKNDNYQNDWDGKPNSGIAVSSDANGLPDGTYYYVVTTSDGRKFVRYMTINR